MHVHAAIFCTIIFWRRIVEGCLSGQRLLPPSICPLCQGHPAYTHRRLRPSTLTADLWDLRCLVSLAFIPHASNTHHQNSNRIDHLFFSLFLLSVSSSMSPVAMPVSSDSQFTTLLEELRTAPTAPGKEAVSLPCTVAYIYNRRKSRCRPLSETGRKRWI